MHFFDRIPSGSLERRETQLTVTASVAIIVLASGLALFMHPVVFSAVAVQPNRTLSSAFFGFCVLSVLLAGYLVDRQLTIQRLRHQIAEDRRRSSDALMQSSADLLQALPNFDAFQDRLAMEYRRADSANEELSVLVIAVKLHAALAGSADAVSALGDAAKVISRKLREQDSIYVLAMGYFGIIVPGVGVSTTQTICARLSEGLNDAAGAANRFTARIDALSYPVQASSVHDLQLAVCGMLPEFTLASQGSIGKHAPLAGKRH